MGWGTCSGQRLQGCGKKLVPASHTRDSTAISHICKLAQRLKSTNNTWRKIQGYRLKFEYLECWCHYTIQGTWGKKQVWAGRFAILAGPPEEKAQEKLEGKEGERAGAHKCNHTPSTDPCHAGQELLTAAFPDLSEPRPTWTKPKTPSNKKFCQLFFCTTEDSFSL